MSIVDNWENTKSTKKEEYAQQFCCLVVNTINSGCDLVFLCECKDVLFLNFPRHTSPFKLTPYIPSPFLPHLFFWMRKRRIREGNVGIMCEHVCLLSRFNRV